MMIDLDETVSVPLRLIWTIKMIFALPENTDHYLKKLKMMMADYKPDCPVCMDDGGDEHGPCNMKCH